MSRNVPATVSRQATLEELESIIEQGAPAVVAAVAAVELLPAYVALAEVHDRKLYKTTHASFEVYCHDRFGISRASAKRWVVTGRQVPELESGQSVSREPLSQRTAAANVKGKRLNAQAHIDVSARDADAPPRARETKPPAPEKPLTGDVCPRCQGTGRIARPAPARAVRAADRSGEVKPSDCAHPPNARLGADCARCGARVGK